MIFKIVSFCFVLLSSAIAGNTLSMKSTNDGNHSEATEWLLSEVTGYTCRVTADKNYPTSYLSFHFDSKTSNHTWVLKVSAPAGIELTTGIYKDAVYTRSVNKARPVLNLVVDGVESSCNGGKFEILSLEWNTEGNLESAAIDFEHTRNPTSLTTGQLRYNSHISINKDEESSKRWHFLTIGGGIALIGIFGPRIARSIKS